ncbi:hypothetical protein A2955_00015 [Candidatus Woesebacteria bacterium RIFCSPLOWO2_01_FULL_37_19]|uniref:Glycosyltransferase 2-like domain-containing protein n=1 Tax=Candidatus Woesebacteria bacterium RIFCSPLOWO2_01_FULL_37_19 TaxID=1802514 RepID=A0A1F8B4R2_9BACT|nr:MAG: hypothetical protein A2955_00015 [Candidatus Woesebacteria bacterium RIFCSPLOWO2_01_FULL_37_19]
MLSVVIIAKNEEENLPDCLKSVSWGNQIILVDTGSIDKTKEIANKFGAKIVNFKGGNYSDWRNAGLKYAKGDWILYIDADERVTPMLRKEITKIISSKNTYSAYAIPRKNIVLGKELKHGGFGEYDYVKRLFKKKDLVKWTGELHEEPNYLYKGKLTIGKKGELGHLKNKMIHVKAQTLEKMVEKTNTWSDVEARLMLEANHPPMNISRFFSAMFREFWFRILKHKAYLDGTVGIIHGLYQVFSRFISYAKLWEMQIKAISEK